MPANFTLINTLNGKDLEALIVAEESYGDSWKKRGGVGAFMMLARKWDRIEKQCKDKDYNIFKALEGMEPTGLIDDIRDLRRYLLLVEQHMMMNKGAALQEGEATKAYVIQDHECP